MKSQLLICFLFVAQLCLSQDEHWKSHPDSTFWNFYTAKTISVDAIQARAGNKRVLLFYYEHTVLPINNFNKLVLSDTAVTNFISANFYPLAIDLDIDNIHGNKNEGRCGVYRKFLKDQTFYIEQTPAFSIYTNNGDLRGSKPFMRVDKSTKEAFMAFLKKRLN